MDLCLATDLATIPHQAKMEEIVLDATVTLEDAKLLRALASFFFFYIKKWVIEPGILL